ncbi:MAG: sulfatase-like hydrolase/transferase [Pseudomonadota bacterium]
MACISSRAGRAPGFDEVEPHLVKKVIEYIDASFGQILDALDDAGLRDNTIVIVSSDNGGVDYAYLQDFGHETNGPYRGQKSELYEGGHRVPLMVRWPSAVAPARINDLVVLTDIFPTLAAILDEPLPDTVAVDGFSFSSLLMHDGTARSKTGRQTAVMHSLFGTFAVRRGPWKLILDDQGGGYGATYPELLRGEIPQPEQTAYRLFNLETDPAENVDVSKEYPEIVEQLSQDLRDIQNADQSRRSE